MAARTGNDAPLWRRLAWFAALWLAGVSAVALVAWAIRLAMPT